MKLYHFSEQSDIRSFTPRQLDYRQNEPAMVWTIDEFHAPHYYFPRDCPRVCIWPSDDTTEADIQRFFGHSVTKRVVAIESRWFERVKSAAIYRYEFAPDQFSLYEANAGYYTSTQTVQPVSVERMDDLLHSLTCLDIEVRITPSLFPLKEAILSSTVNFSMIRMKYAQ
ncbi:DUF6886 family protein [Paenibacillus allorhizosphaerae]|uniref:DUF4433 domain-containing protein n=1 Tax=Paenibacillus allorhizosphaerae TaxID=2849866 RepID=A0ABN7TK33_9BACL|nr:DUF6886 family protein [Paenibacillus allorhizosphaerae]CAG7642363.1 hypothetical protein PAECIP111802_02849 [Paenibacillus allorhizosphaerae]